MILQSPLPPHPHRISHRIRRHRSHVYLHVMRNTNKLMFQYQIDLIY